ncbi:hypothetical protein [Tsuneonella deserti]|nr:hypothetical protein [Tsuneonella deserti]
MSEQQERTLEQFQEAFRHYGYFVAATPIEGMEDVFLDDLRAALRKVEETAAHFRKGYGYRGVSRRLLEELHNSLPAPSANVESAIAPELRARERRGRT